MTEVPEEKLFNQFPGIPKSEWEKKIREDLKGVDYDNCLVYKTLDGLNLQPYYRAEDTRELKYLDGFPGEFPYVRTGKKDSNSWEIRQDLVAGEPAETSRLAAEIINRGVTSLGLKVNSSIINSVGRLSELLEHIPLENISLNLLSGKDSLNIAGFLIEETGARQLNSNNLRGTFDFDPIGNLTVKGKFYHSEDEDFYSLKNLIEKLRGSLPLYKAIEVNALNLSNAGVTPVQQIALALSMGSEYIARLTGMGFQVDDIAGRMQFTFGTGTGYFIEIAGLRAVRLLWSKIVEAYKPGDFKNALMSVHAVTTGWNRTLYDPYVNMLRSTTEAMSAILGGADSVEILPFDSVSAGESEFSLRNARNVQTVLKEEAYFDRVIDPGAGSYYIGNLTDSIAEHAWKLFLEIEDKGGYISAFKSGFIQQIVDEIAKRRLHNIATGREVLLGTNCFPDARERAGENIKKSDQQVQEREDMIAQPVRLVRGAREFEKIRLQAEKSSLRPKVFIIGSGNVAKRNARITFSKNFFTSAGYEVSDIREYSDLPDAVQKALDKKASVIVLCSGDDKAYLQLAPEASNMIGKRAILVLAGEPACRAELETKGIKNLISLRSDRISTFSNYNKQLGII